VVRVKSLTGPVTSASVWPGITMPTSTCATSAMTDRPRQMNRNRHRSLGTTELSQRGRSRWTTRLIAQVTRIIEPSVRLR
jgi:hypothetical protein